MIGQIYLICLNLKITYNIIYSLQKLMITADYDRLMQSEISSEGITLSTFNQSVYSMQSSTHTQHTRQSFENKR